MTTAAARASWERFDAAVESWLERRSGVVGRDAALADALRTIAAATRAGASLQQALSRAAMRGRGLVARECAAASSRIALGLPVEREVARMGERIGTPAAALFAQVVGVQHRRGGDLAAPCHRLAGLLHERIRLDAEARSATAQARFSARAVLASRGLLVLAAGGLPPDQVRAALHPGPLLLATPGIVLIVAGALVARRVARHAVALGTGRPAGGSRSSALRTVVRRIAGEGPRSRRGARLALVAFACCVPTLTTASATAVACSITAIAAAAAWPWADLARERRHRAGVAGTGIESLLEVSIALFSAGATAHQVATLAPAGANEPLRSALAPAVDRIGLGRSIASAYASVPEVAALPQLDGWLHAVCASAELGAPAVDVLEHLLRDARSVRREQLRSIAQTAAPRMQLALVLLVVPGVMWLMLLATLGGLVEQLRAAGVV
jgi:Flp pilus assembly protein TadB